MRNLITNEVSLEEVKNVKNNKKKKGFTLIELIVVIAILGILAAVAVPRLTGFQESARTNSDAANIKTLTSAATMYLAENGNPAADLDAAASKTALTGKYIESWPTSPWANTTNAKASYTYKVTISSAGVITVVLSA